MEGENKSINEFRGINSRRLLASLIVTAIFMLVELFGGIWVNSMSLVNDAGHMLTHVFSIIIAITGARIAQKPPCHHKTFGSYRAEILAAFLNGLFLLFVVGYLLFETISKILAPEPIDAIYMLYIAILGLVVNIISLIILHDTEHSDLNVNGVLSHVAADTGSSVGVIVAAIVIFFTSWVLIDALVSLVISILILGWAIGILRESGRILLEYPPQNVTIDEIRDEILKKFRGRVEDVYHLHLWTITSNINVVSFHVKICCLGNDLNGNIPELKQLFMEINEFLKDRYKIMDSTIQISQDEDTFACAL
ncbi:MAG: cation transporter [Candidatus Lokiarchaeota archaeon]|nr:cation transporter [Candidatus Lokiarchaeota archaeon]